MSSQPYNPDALPLNNLDYRLLLPLVGQANAALHCQGECFVEHNFVLGLYKLFCRVWKLHNVGRSK